MKHTPPCLLLALCLLASFFGCAPPQEPDAPDAPAEDPAPVVLTELWRVDTGLLRPESVVFDAARDALYLTNIHGESAEKDGNGYLTRIAADGAVVAEQWVSGLDGPKGIALHDDRLYVADIDALVVIDPETGDILDRYVVEGDVYLNDVAVHPDGTVYVSDSRFSKIYRLAEDALEVWLEDPQVQMPNGVHVVGSELYVAAGDPSAENPGGARYLQAVSLADRQVRPLRGREPVGALDTVEPDGAGGLFVTDWAEGRLLYFDPDRGLTLLRQLGQGAADVEYVADRRTLYVPVMTDGLLIAYEVAHQAAARPPAMTEHDVGVVFYRPGASAGTLDAVWYATNLRSGRSGSGHATGGPGDGFAGQYQITYTLANGSNLGTFDLHIARSGEPYTLTWLLHGDTLFVGMGVETPDGLAAGWRKAG